MEGEGGETATKAKAKLTFFLTVGISMEIKVASMEKNRLLHGTIMSHAPRGIVTVFRHSRDVKNQSLHVNNYSVCIKRWEVFLEERREKYMEFSVTCVHRVVYGISANAVANWLH